jgi:hypothetical protein
MSAVSDVLKPELKLSGEENGWKDEYSMHAIYVFETDVTILQSPPSVYL